MVFLENVNKLKRVKKMSIISHSTNLTSVPHGRVPFTKMHGIGNDYIYFNCLDGVPFEDIKQAAIELSDRHFGIGGDGIVLILPSEKADYRMRMFNADGSESQMCGNAVRCVGKYLFDKRITNKNPINLETLAGIIVLHLEIGSDVAKSGMASCDATNNGIVKSVRVDMGEPILDVARIPVTYSKTQLIDEILEFDGMQFKATCVSMGNPHIVLFVDEITDSLVHGLGPKIENAKIFPQRTNVEFVKVLSPDLLQMRVWERGSGETLACGTGACACAVASALTGRTKRIVSVKLLGGSLLIEWSVNNHVFKTGPASFVFEGLV